MGWSTRSRPEHPPILNAPSPIVVTEDGMINEVKLEHPSNAPWPIVVTEDGMINEVKPEHPENTPSPSVITEDGMINEVKPEHPSKMPPKMPSIGHRGWDDQRGQARASIKILPSADRGH